MMRTYRVKCILNELVMSIYYIRLIILLHILNSMYDLFFGDLELLEGWFKFEIHINRSIRIEGITINHAASEISERV